jgi:hypothetical protein
MFKVILIIVGINFATAKPPILYHRTVDTMEQCEKVAAETPRTTSDGYKLGIFCIEENDILEVKSIG